MDIKSVDLIIKNPIIESKNKDLIQNNDRKDTKIIQNDENDECVKYCCCCFGCYFILLQILSCA